MPKFAISIPVYVCISCVITVHHEMVSIYLSIYFMLSSKEKEEVFFFSSCPISRFI